MPKSRIEPIDQPIIKKTKTPGHVGAPLGNKNAVKHGMYSTDRKFDLSSCQREGIQQEISYIRAVLDFVVSIIPSLENPDLIIRSLSTVATSTVKLSFLLEHLSRKSSSDEISEAIRQVNQEFRRQSYNYHAQKN